MKSALGILAVGLLLVAPAATATAANASASMSYVDNRETQPPGDMMGQRHYGNARCRSEASDKADAVEYCESQLKCAQQTPPMTTTCTGQPSRWICQCR
jgi:curli biogenesis system outer membrane secretion channel CsgG